MEIGTISGIKKDDGRIICTVDFGADDAITAVLYGAASQNEYPLIDDEVAVNRSDDENIIVAVFRPVPDELESGERIMYGRDADGATVSSVKLCSDGTVNVDGDKVVVNGGGRTSVAFEDLKSGFDQLKNDFNNFLSTGHDVHTHTAPTGPTTPPLVIPSVQSQASIDNSKSETVEIP